MRREQKSTGRDRSQKQEAVRSTRVSGRSPNSGKKWDVAARGVEVLLKKAAVDPQFRALLLKKRAEAAEAINLVLKPHETAMINAVFEEHLAAMIAKTEVPKEHRRIFLGTAATAMLAALVGVQEISSAQVTGGGFGGFAADLGQWAIVPVQVIAFVSTHLDLEKGTVTQQSRIRDLAKDDAECKALREALEDHFDVSLPGKEFDQLNTVAALSDRIANSLEVKPKVLQLIAEQTGVPKAKLTHGTLLTDDLHIDRRQLVSLRRDLGRQLRVYVDWELFKQFQTVGEVVNYAGGLVARYKQAQQEKKKKRP